MFFSYIFELIWWLRDCEQILAIWTNKVFDIIKHLATRKIINDLIDLIYTSIYLVITEIEIMIVKTITYILKN